MTSSTGLNHLITGAGASVGRVTAEKFLALEGSAVHICDVREEAVAATLEANPGMEGTVCNVGNRDDVDRLCENATRQMGHVDVLVNCVGIGGGYAPLEDVTEDDWQTTLQVNVTGMFYTMQKVIPGMKARRFGSIVNFSSSSTVTRLPNRAPYVVSKYAVEGLTKNTARELGPYNVRCNAILPGAINNERMQNIWQRVARSRNMPVEEFEKEALRYMSMRAKIEPYELADTVLFLCSEKAPHITGQLMEVSGGAEWEE